MRFSETGDGRSQCARSPLSSGGVRGEPRADRALFSFSGCVAFAPRSSAGYTWSKGERMKPNFVLIVLDVSAHWRIGDGVLRVQSVYLTDLSRVVHCCELTPSYELEHVETRAVLPDDVSEETRVRIDEVVRINEYGETIYIHRRLVDARLRDNPAGTYRPGDTTGATDEDYEETRERTLEYVRCNSKV